MELIPIQPFRAQTRPLVRNAEPFSRTFMSRDTDVFLFYLQSPSTSKNRLVADVFRTPKFFGAWCERKNWFNLLGN